MAKNYEKYALRVNGFNAIFRDTVAKKAEEMKNKISDYRLSDRGKEEAVKKVYDELQAICENMDNAFHKAVKEFSSEYAITLPNDGKDHATDIENAFRVIEMLGYRIDVRNLNNILEPLKGNYKALKTVLDVMRVKEETAVSGFGTEKGYSYQVMNLIDQYSGVTTTVSDFLMTMEDIEAITESPSGYSFESGKVGNVPVALIEHIPYSYLSCSDWMTEAGKTYETLQGEFSTLYSGVQTDNVSV